MEAQSAVDRIKEIRKERALIHADRAELTEHLKLLRDREGALFEEYKKLSHGLIGEEWYR